jgi:hypothetical protein
MKTYGMKLRLFHAVAALCAVITASACTFAPPAGSCDADPLPSYTCDGPVLVSSVCNGGRFPSVSRIDCATSGEQCVSTSASEATCLRPCHADTDCDATQYCSSQRVTSNGDGICTPPAQRFDTCEQSTSTRGCVAGSSCLDILATGKSTAHAECTSTCTSSADCGYTEYCSNVMVSATGASTCQQRSDVCDPADPTSCPPGTTCVVLQSNYALYACE